MPPTLFTRLRHRWARLQGGPSPGAATAAQTPAQLQGPAAGAAAAADANPTPPVPYDEALLDRARTQWPFGDWASLAGMTQEQIQHHPDRAKLALLAAMSRRQHAANTTARQLKRLAQPSRYLKSLGRSMTRWMKRPRGMGEQHRPSILKTGRLTLAG